ncbi:MAG: hypothetical protein LBJ72_02980 [Dysgonamonadaceae bacterium]|nr:hypothetical protein [Dysgonamonadaceae bacterium]
MHKQPAPNVIVGNPVLFEIESDNANSIHYIVRIAQYNGIGNYIAFEGVLFPASDMSGKYFSLTNISEILKSFVNRQTNPTSTSQLVSLVTDFFQEFSVDFYGQSGENLFYQGRFSPGGISKSMLRYLSNQYTDIFAYKLTNTSRQFFMTTRTFGRNIVLKENELSPFYFVATGKVYSVATEHGNTFPFPAMIPGEVYAFSPEALRQMSYNLYGKIPSYLKILVDGQHIFDITIRQDAKSPNKYVLQFLNSFGVFEKLEITGKAIAEPEIDTSGNVFMRYDKIVDDYIEQNNRTPLREIIKADSGYKTKDEFLFIRDMLQSDKCYLIDQHGSRQEVRVSCENFSHDIFPTEPGSVQLKIRLIDSDSNYSPFIDEGVSGGIIPGTTYYLTDNFGNHITDNFGNNITVNGL